MSSSMMNRTLSLGSSPGSSVSGCLDDGVGGDHVDALPRTDVDAAFAHDALGLVDVDELLRLDRLREVVGVDLDELVLVGVRHHRRVRVGACHQRYPFLTNGRPYVLVASSVLGLVSPRPCHTFHRKRIRPKYQTCSTTTTVSRIASYDAVNGKLPPKRLRLQQIEGTVDDLALRPPEVAVGVVDPLVGHHTERDEHDTEHVHRGEHCLAPRHRGALGTALRIRDRGKGHSGRQHKRKQERRIDAWPFEDVDRDQHRAAFRVRSECELLHKL